MAISPKFRPATIPRYSSSNSTATTARRNDQRRFIILISFVLLVTSGTMLVFRAVTHPLSSNGDGAGCNADADFTIIRWKPKPIAEQKINLDIVHGARDAGSPSNNNNNVEHNDRYGYSKIGLDNNPVQQLSDYSEKPINPDNKNSDETTLDEGEDGEDVVEEEEEEEEEEDYLPFQASLDREDNAQYLTYLPYAGITNQFYGMLRGMEVAKALGRTLIIPPITASSHDKSKQNQPWSKFLDLDRFQELTGAKVIEFHKLRDAELEEYNQLECKITCGFGSKRTIDFTAKGFLKQLKFNVTLSPLQIDTNQFGEIIKALAPHRSDNYICISNTYKISVKDKSEWSRFGQHLHFTEELEDFVQGFLDKHLLKPAAIYDPKSRQEIVPTQKYIAIHVRRGDFAQYCETNFPGAKRAHCLPTTEEIAQRIDKIQSNYNPSGSLTEIMPVFVATNERRPEELKKFADLGWMYLDHDRMGTAEALGVFGPMMVDQVLMAHSQALVGIHMSTFSRVGALRQQDWHNRQIEYM